MRMMIALAATILLGGCTLQMSTLDPRAGEPVASDMPSGGGRLLAGPIVNPGNGHVYYLLKPDTWTNCEEMAVRLGGHLATVRNAEEQKWMVATFGPEKDFSEHGFWIGLRQNATGDYVWASGETCSYRNWEVTEPNGSGSPDGMYTFVGRYADGGWNDTNDRNLGANDGTPWSDFGPLPRGLVEVVPAGVNLPAQ